MKLIHQCKYCFSNIFDVTEDLCWKSMSGKHFWTIVEKEEEQQQKVIYA